MTALSAKELIDLISSQISLYNVKLARTEGSWECSLSNSTGNSDNHGICPTINRSIVINYYIGDNRASKLELVSMLNDMPQIKGMGTVEPNDLHQFITVFYDSIETPIVSTLGVLG